ncbi:MAG: ribonuclease H-like domain-containing protein [Bacillota bacterium]
MKHIVEEWQQNICDSALWDFYFSGMRTGSLDIETTGLDPNRNKFVLGGVYDAEAGRLHQVLAESRAEEADALAEYMDTLADLDVVVTYNGRNFDIPFVDTRLAACGSASANCGHLYDLDLYQVLSGHSQLRRLLPNMRQKTVENYMGLWNTRADEISGAESVELFNRYELTGDPEAEAKILLHNNDDVRQLTRLTAAIKKSNFHKAMFRMGFPVRAAGRMLTVRDIKLCRDTIEYSGVQNRNPVNYAGFEYRGWPVMSSFGNGSFRISVPVTREHGMTVVDLEAAGIQDESFENYPDCVSGFLVIETADGIRYRETNHFIKEFTRIFMEENL